MPSFSTGFIGIPITNAVTGNAPQFWTGPAIRFKVGIDQITNGVPAIGGADARVIWTDQEQATLAYIKQVTNPDVWDSQFQQALVAALAGRMVYSLIGDKALANLKLGEANETIKIARAGDGNEGLTVNNVTPDWIRTRGWADPSWGFSPNQQFDWGGLLSLY